MILSNVSNLCKERKISIARLEREVGIGNGVISGWENGNPRVDTLKKVADYFGVTVDELLKEQEGR